MKQQCNNLHNLMSLTTFLSLNLWVMSIYLVNVNTKNKSTYAFDSQCCFLASLSSGYWSRHNLKMHISRWYSLYNILWLILLSWEWYVTSTWVILICMCMCTCQRIHACAWRKSKDRCRQQMLSSDVNILAFHHLVWHLSCQQVFHLGGVGWMGGCVMSSRHRPVTHCRHQ